MFCHDELVLLIMRARIPVHYPRLPSVCFPPHISRPRGAAEPREMATAPRPPAFVSSAGPPARQRRAALDFLARELQALEIESRVKQDLETRVSSLERDLHRSEQLNAQYLRRIDMLEQQLRHARGEGPAPAEQEAASSGGEVFQGLATMVPPTSLAAAAAKLPLPPPPLAPFDDGADALSAHCERRPLVRHRRCEAQPRRDSGGGRAGRARGQRPQRPQRPRRAEVTC